jgi:poly-gamma-glutamate capsule biosynthesis protein CapA/YwtB (metallophosphatase superfamily)
VRRRNRGSFRRRKIDYKKFLISLIIIISAIIAITIGINSAINIASKPEEEQKEQKEVIPEDIVINLVATGDVMCHTTNFNSAYDTKTKSYDFTPVFANVAKYITKADIAISNLETTFAGADRGYTGYPTFNSPSELGQALKNIGIDVVSTANNHSLDKGYTGVVSTLDKLDEIGIEHVGTARSEEEQKDILIKNVNGIRIAFLSFTYGTNGIPVQAGKEFSVNLLEKELILEQLKLAKAENVDIICVSMHWGVEYAQKQNSEQEKWADFLFENGVDIIIRKSCSCSRTNGKKNYTIRRWNRKRSICYIRIRKFHFRADI